MRPFLFSMAPFAAVTFVFGGCGAAQEGTAAGSEPPPPPEMDTGEAPPIVEETATRVLSPDDETAVDTAADAEAVPTDIYAEAAPLEEPTPVDVEVPVLLDYQHAEVVPQEGHRGPIVHIAISDDSRLILTASRDDTFKLISRDSGLLLRTFFGATPPSRGIPNRRAAFAPGGKVLGVVGDAVHVWEMGTGDALQTIRLEGGFPSGVSVSSDGRLLFAGYRDHCEVWNLTTGAFQQTVPLGDDSPGSTPLTETCRTAVDQRVSTTPTAPDGTFKVSTDPGYNVLISGRHLDPETGKTRYTLDKTFRSSTSQYRLTAAASSWYASIVLGDNDSYVWNLNKGFMKRRFTLRYRRTEGSAALSPDGGRLLDNNRLWDLAQSREIGLLSREGRYIYPVSSAFSPDSRHVTVIDAKFGISTWTVGSGDTLRQPVVSLDMKTNGTLSGIAPNQVVYSGDGRHLLIGGRAPVLLNAADLSEERRFPVSTRRVAFFPDGEHVILANQTSGASLWTRNGSSPVFTFRENAAEETVDCALSPDGRRLAVITAKDAAANSLTVWDTYQRKVIFKQTHPELTLNGVRFVGDGAHLLTVGQQSFPRLWNLENGRSAVLMMDGDEWAVCTEDGYFDASRRGGHLLALVQGNRGYRVDQLSIKYNRPDVVLRDLGLGNPELIAHYYEMYLKRLRKLGVKEEDVDEVFAMAPKATIETVEHKGKWVRLTARMTAGESPLSRYNLYVNDVPIYGLEGQPIHGKKTRVEMVLELTEGLNQLEVGVTNERGIESLRDKHTTTYAGKAEKHDLYYLGFGVSRYANPELTLKYASKDARELEAVFREVYAGYNRVHSRSYTDEAVSAAAFAEARSFLKDAKVDDTVVLFVAGHGLYDPDNDEDYYYLLHGTDLDRLKETAMPFSIIENLLADIQPRRKLFLLDTCQSGELDEGEETQVLASATSRGLIHRGIRKKTLTGHISKKKSLRKYLEERDQRFIYNDVTRRSGTMIISSSRGSEFSYEKDDLQNGVFTEEVYNAFTSPTADRNNDKKLSIDELRDYVFKAVSEHTDGLQHPVVDRDNLELTFEFPLIKTAAPQ